MNSGLSILDFGLVNKAGAGIGGNYRGYHRRLYSPIQNPKSKIQKGFTLIEVLTTMVVMAIVLPIAMRGISLTLQAAEMAKRSALAATLADGKLNELSSSTALTNAGSSSGDFSPDYPEYQWQATTTSITLGLEQIDVQVTWRSRDGERKLTVSSVIYPQGGTSQ